ncbi:MAG: LPXTG cell wall anchor domain-containing protein [Lachnospiraceae bacterium]|nr:LPXTG cell wall anchor domain-containing protein [Lachnospiraceae bacterium]
MLREQIPQAQKYTRQNHRRRIWKKIVGGLGCIVVFCTTYALILPAITMENDITCTIEEHTHTIECYEKETGTVTDTEKTLICKLPEVTAHVHTDSCYGTADSTKENASANAGHSHTEECYTSEKGDLICELEETDGHVHTESCYGEKRLICELSESEGHAHGDSCYEEKEELTCGLAESEGHTHGEGCYDEGGELTCTTEESEGHTHTDSCYSTTRELVCELSESEGHIHGDDCYESALTCGEAGSEGHHHTDDCYEWKEVLICNQEEASETGSEEMTAGTDGSDGTAGSGSSDENSSAERVLICGQEEVKLHAHTDACMQDGEYICGQEEVVEHAHTESCYGVIDDDALTCELEEDENHEHSELCYGKWKLVCEKEEHTHGLACHADPEADVETAEDWEKTFADVELTGNWSVDVIAIAQTQLGYTESTKNYIVLEDNETMKGYTRYGEWYGDPYGDWDAMFVSFCLHYAEVTGMPLDSEIAGWIESLSSEEYELYYEAADYSPQTGDLIFLDENMDGTADHVALVAELTEETEEETAQIKTITGDVLNRVQQVTCDADDEKIIGYAQLPVQLTEEQQARVDEVIALIDEMPGADEIDATLAEYEEKEDYEGEEAWYTEVCQQVAKAYYYYSQLSDAEKRFVTNADKLLELEYIWSVTEYYAGGNISWTAPTTVESAHTSEFIELNLYDYGSNINDKYQTDDKYLGFQWNGGAYMYDGNKFPGGTDGLSGTMVDRNKIDGIDFGNSMITDYKYGNTSNYAKSENAWLITENDGDINQVDRADQENYGVNNRPIGMSTGEAVLQNTLKDGYPALADGTSLSYLFNSSERYANKKNTISIDGLFQQNPESGAYYYNSRENHAQYSDNKFTLYNEIITPNFITYPFGNFMPFNVINDQTKATKVGGFNYEGGAGDYIQEMINRLMDSSDYKENTTKRQLATMLVEYRENWKEYQSINEKAWDDFSASDAIKDYFLGDENGAGDKPSSDINFLTTEHLNKMYNIDYDIEKNFFFGMEMKINFYQPKGGMTGKDKNNDGNFDYPMVFSFTGDDDVWVYIDDVLFLDLSGIHRHVGGKIDFVHGKVYYYALDTDKGDVNIDLENVEEGSAYKTYTFKELLEAAGKSTDGLNEEGTFEDYSNHQLHFYYMERGSGSSVCRLNFNLPMLRQHTLSVEKEVPDDSDTVEALSNYEYKFQVLKANSKGEKTDEQFLMNGWAYSLYDANGNALQEVRVIEQNQDGTIKKLEVYNAEGKVVRTEENGVVTNYPQNGNVLTLDDNGIFTLKAGQKAEFVGIPETQGKYYVRELLAAEAIGQYGEIRINGEVTQPETDNVTINDTIYKAVESPVKDMSNGSTTFRIDNKITTERLGSLSIEKILNITNDKTGKTFKFKVMLDGEPLPKNTEYTIEGVSGSQKVEVDETDGKVTASYVEVPQGKKAVISNIVAGSAFEVTEINTADYTVSYEVDGNSQGAVNASGTIGVDKDVSVVVTNSEKGASVEIPVLKAMSVYGSVGRNFGFYLEEIVSDTDHTAVQGGTKDTQYVNALAADEGANARTTKFTLSYPASKITDSDGIQEFYYKISEIKGDDLVKYDETCYIVEVTVTKNAENMSADVTKVWKVKADGTKELISEKSTFTSQTISFTNTILRSLIITKTVSGSAEDKKQDFEFTVKLGKGDSNTTVPETLTGEKYGADGKLVETKTYTVGTEGEIRIKLKDGEKLKLIGVPYKSVWEVTEKKADGYVVTYQIIVNGKVTESKTAATAGGSADAANTTVSFTNARTYALPETGGFGTTPYTLAGLLLILCSAAYLLYRNQKRRREVSDLPEYNKTK